MSKDNLQKLTTAIEEEVIISLKILSLKRRVSLGEYVKDVLTAHVKSKSKVIETAEEV